MPTIDQLAPANAASDADELLVTQNGIYRKISRGDLLAGFQQEIAAATGTLVGRHSPGTGVVEEIAIGANLSLSNGVLTANAAPFIAAGLPGGTVPAQGDIVPLGQSGADVSVTYGEFMAGLSGIAGIDVSQLTVRASGSVEVIKLADLASTAALTTGAVMTGSLELASDPALPLQAATKQYVDASGMAALPKSGGALSGPLTLAVDPSQPLEAATKQYVDAQAGELLNLGGGTLSGALTLAGSAQNTIKNGSLYVGNSDFQHAVLSTSGPQTALFNKIGSATTDTSVVQTYYYVGHSGGVGKVINNLAVGTTVASTPADGVWGLLSSLTSSSGGGNGGTTGHVGGYFQTVRAAVPNPVTTLTGVSSGSSAHVADVTDCFTGYATGVGYPVSAAHPLPVLINGNPYAVTACTPDFPGATSGPGTLTLGTPIAVVDAQAGNPLVGQVTGANLWGGIIEYREQVDLPSSKSGYGQVLELDWSGNNSDDVETRCFISAVLGKNSVSGSDVEVGNVIGVWPGTGASQTGGASIKRGLQINLPFSQAVVDTRKATQKAGANAIWLADGQTIALSTDGKWAIRFDSGRPGLAFLLNGGVLGWIDTLSRYCAPGGVSSSGPVTNNAVLQGGQAAFDARDALQATGSHAVWLSDGQRIALSSDGLHTISYDGASGAITVAGLLRFASPPVLPSYTVSALPPSPLPGAKAFVLNGRKSGDAPGAGTGVEVFADGSGRWISVLSGIQVQA